MEPSISASPNEASEDDEPELTGTISRPRAEIVPGTAAIANAFCAECRKDAKIRVCSKCKVIPYCSTECQRNDWPKHKPNCHRPTSDSLSTIEDKTLKLVQRVFQPKLVGFVLQVILSQYSYVDQADVFDTFVPILFWDLVPAELPDVDYRTLGDGMWQYMPRLIGMDIRRKNDLPPNVLKSDRALNKAAEEQDCHKRGPICLVNRFARGKDLEKTLVIHLNNVGSEDSIKRGIAANDMLYSDQFASYLGGRTVLEATASTLNKCIAYDKDNKLHLRSRLRYDE